MTDEQATNFFSHFPVEGSLQWDELCAFIDLPEEPRQYFFSAQHVTREVFGTHEEYVAATAQHVGETLLKAS